jgi:hypothetical protein
MSFEILDDGDYYAPGLSGFGVLPLVPLFLFGGGAAVAGTVSRLLKADTEWTTGEYNYWMDYIDGTWKVWDGVGWDKGCWAKNPRVRQEWVNFGARFAKQNSLGRMKIGGFGHDIYLPDQYELSARNLLGELRGWGDRLNALCKAGTVQPGPDKPPPPPPGPNEPTDLGTMLKWGAVVVGGILALNVVSTFKNFSR